MIKIRFFCEASNKSGLGHLIRSLNVMNEFIKLDTSMEIEMWLDKKVDVDRFTNPFEKYIFDLNLFKYNFDSEISNISVIDMLTWSKRKIEINTIASKSCLISLSPVSDINEFADFVITRGRLSDIDNEKNIFGDHLAVIRNDINRLDENQYKDLISSNRNHIGVVMGGTDPTNMSLEIVKRLSKINFQTTLWLAIGNSYSFDINLIFEAVSKSKSVDLIVGSVFEDLWMFLNKCQLLILQGGLTTTEASYRGIPSINIPRFSKQKNMMPSLFKKGGAWIIDNDKLDQLIETIENIISNKKNLINASNIGKEIIDGKGAERIKSIIISKSSKI